MMHFYFFFFFVQLLCSESERSEKYSVEYFFILSENSDTCTYLNFCCFGN